LGLDRIMLNFGNFAIVNSCSFHIFSAAELDSHSLQPELFRGMQQCSVHFRHWTGSTESTNPVNIIVDLILSGCTQALRPVARI